ncbi:MAG TPA: DUF3800 domain-containing protein [Patescibacteria group bacterium]|nr:DUF3800 domain-containing protein [Patescibacteria group bacterium]
MSKKVQKLYVYVDETGQDAGSDCFIVVAIITAEDQQKLKESLLELEQSTKLGEKKWHKSKALQREKFLQETVNKNIAAGEVYYSHYKKPLPFFFPLLVTVSKAIAAATNDPYQAIIYVDGIDKKKAKELTNALRLEGVKTLYVRSARDESEPMIRLADRWAGCVRASFENQPGCKQLVAEATNRNHLKLV